MIMKQMQEVGAWFLAPSAEDKVWKENNKEGECKGRKHKYRHCRFRGR